MARQATLVIRGGTLLRGPGLEPERGLALVVEGERIARIARESEIAHGRGWRVLDAAGHTVLPGLVEAHMHFFGSKSPDPRMWSIEPPFLDCARAVFDAWKVLDYGFTTVRDVGSRNGVALKQAIDEGSIVGPRILPAHLGLSMTCGHGDVHNVPSKWLCGCSMMAFIVDGVDNVRQAVRQTVRDGADVVKVWVSGGTMSERDSLEDQHFSDEELMTIVGESHRLRRKVAAHAEGLLGARAAIRAGVDSIEHGFVLDEEACAEMRKRGTFLVATLALLDRVVNTPGVPEYAKVKARPMFQAHLDSFRLALQMGVKIGSGSDAFSDPITRFGEYNIRELALMVDAGMTPLAALRAATADNAELLGWARQIGSLDEGKLADVLLVKGELADSIEPLMTRGNVTTILKGGRVMPRLKGVLPE
jgi:imidazolonepropionase-like amidohydrolase